jgi:hypothetical protein
LELFDLFLGHSASSIETVATSGTAHVLYESLDETLIPRDEELLHLPIVTAHLRGRSQVPTRDVNMPP